MPKLSAKQQKNLERKWELKDQERKLMLAMADAIRGLAEQRDGLRTEINALEDQVPDSVQDTWDEVDGNHIIWESPADCEDWREAYNLLKKASNQHFLR